jgi:dihydroflavonol-4-reductase
MILVTGGTGLVGSHLIWHLLQKGEKVRAIHRFGSHLEQVIEVFGYYDSPSGEKKQLRSNFLERWNGLRPI